MQKKKVGFKKRRRMVHRRNNPMVNEATKDGDKISLSAQKKKDLIREGRQEKLVVGNSKP